MLRFSSTTGGRLVGRPYPRPSPAGTKEAECRWLRPLRLASFGNAMTRRHDPTSHDPTSAPGGHVRIGIQASYSGDFQETAAEIRDLESAGLDVAMVAEVYTFDAVSQLGYLAAVTERVELMSGILPIYSRTPALTAMTAAGLDFVSGGRFTLGLGASGPQVIEGWHGVPYDAPLQRTREVVEICRQVWRRDRLEHHGKKYEIPLPADQGTGLGKPLKLINTPVRERVPVMLAALGPKNVELAAEIAELWQPIWFQPEKSMDVWGESLAAGKAKRDPALGDLQIVVGVPVAVGEIGRAH